MFVCVVQDNNYSTIVLRGNITIVLFAVFQIGKKKLVLLDLMKRILMKNSKKQKKIVKLVKRWQQGEAGNATFEALAKALENIDCRGDARQIRDLAMTVT